MRNAPPYTSQVDVPGQFVAHDAVAFATQKLKFRLDPRQAEILSGNMHRVLLCCSRQWGKSTIAAIAATHHLLTRPGAFVAVVSPAQKQSAELIRKVRFFLDTLQVPYHSDPIHKHSLELAGGNRIIALTSRQATNRGPSAVTFLIFDEAAYIADEVYDACTPFLGTTNGDIWLISTPNGKRGFFWEFWAGDGPWTRYLVTAKENPRLSEEFLQEELRARGSRRFRQEYECEFLDDLGSLFDVSLFLTAVTDDFKPLGI